MKTSWFYVIATKIKQYLYRTSGEIFTWRFLGTTILLFGCTYILRTFFVCHVFIFSGSMEPTLITGSRALSLNYQYGYSIMHVNPTWHYMTKGRIFERNPERGDVIGFYPYPGFFHNKHYQSNPYAREWWTKRIIGLPGDTIEINDNNLYINGEKVLRTKIPQQLWTSNMRAIHKKCPSMKFFQETTCGHTHVIQIDSAQKLESWQSDMTERKVPPDHYFVMGDNRGHSADSRFYAFVPCSNIIGKIGIITIPSRLMSLLTKIVRGQKSLGTLCKRKTYSGIGQKVI